jgi:hypothetical protein
MMRSSSIEEIVNHISGLGIIGEKAVEEWLKNPKRQSIANAIVDIPDGCIIFSIPKVYDKGEFIVQRFIAQLIKSKNIEHGIHQGIDTAKLELQIAAIDWQTNAKKIEDGSTLESSLFYDVVFLRLAANQMGQQIADDLALKYFAATPVLEKLPFKPDFSEYYQQFSFPLAGDLTDLGQEQVINLFSGRAVLQMNDKAAISQKQWLTLEGGVLIPHEPYDITGIIKGLNASPPFSEKSGPYLIYRLAAGYREKIGLIQNGKYTNVFIEADPVNKTIRLFDLKGHRLDLKEFLGNTTYGIKAKRNKGFGI